MGYCQDASNEPASTSANMISQQSDTLKKSLARCQEMFDGAIVIGLKETDGGVPEYFIVTDLKDHNRDMILSLIGLSAAERLSNI